MVYDQDCHIEARHMTMQPVQLGALGAVAAASAVVSGSIVITGNAVYWFEKQGRCLAQAGA